jgi:hypothetical protein
MKKSLILGLFIIVSQINAKVLIFTYAYNRPDFVEIQHKTFKKFLTDDYEFIVFSDARSQDMKNSIKAICTQYGLKCIQIPQEIHDRPYLQRWPGEDYNHPTVRNVNVVQYSLDLLGFNHNDILILLDSDAFLVKKFSFREFLNGYDMGGRALGINSRIGSGDIQYLWHGLAFLNMGTMPNKRTLNFNCGKVEGRPVDAGGHSYYYLKHNPQVRVHYIDHNFSDELRCNICIRINAPYCTHNTGELRKAEFDEFQINFLQSAHDVEFFCNNSFLHYRCGSNWDYKSQQYHNQKTEALQRYLNAILG